MSEAGEVIQVPPVKKFSAEQLADLRIRNRALNGDPRNVRVIGEDDTPETRERLAYVGREFVNRVAPGSLPHHLDDFQRALVDVGSNNWSPSVFSLDISTMPVQTERGKPEKTVAYLAVNTVNERMGVNAPEEELMKYNKEMETTLNGILHPEPPQNQ